MRVPGTVAGHDLPAAGARGRAYQGKATSREPRSRPSTAPAPRPGSARRRPVVASQSTIRGAAPGRGRRAKAMRPRHIDGVESEAPTRRRTPPGRSRPLARSTTRRRQPSASHHARPPAGPGCGSLSQREKVATARPRRSVPMSASKGTKRQAARDAGVARGQPPARTLARAPHDPARAGRHRRARAVRMASGCASAAGAVGAAALATPTITAATLTCSRASGCRGG